MYDFSKLAVVILNYNSAELTSKCVDQLLKLSLPFHIVIVDNLSPDGSYETLRKRYAKYDKSVVSVLNTGANKGYSFGNNFGVRYAIKEFNIDYFAIANPDVIIPTAEVFTSMMTTINNDSKCAVIGASVINPGGIYVPAFSAWKIPTRKDFVLSRSLFGRNPFAGIQKWKLYSERVAEVECVAGCFYIASVNLLSKLGFLDEDIFMYNEEILLGYKVRKNGYHELLQLDQFYYHNHEKKPSPTLKNFISGRKLRFQSDVTLYKKIYSGGAGLALMYLLEGINRVVLFPWFALKPVFDRS